MVDNYGDIAIGISSLILALLGFFQFVTTYMKSSNERINALEDDKRQLASQNDNLKLQIDTLTKEADKWKKIAYREHRKVTDANAKISVYQKERSRCQTWMGNVKKRHAILIKENTVMKRKLEGK